MTDDNRCLITHVDDDDFSTCYAPAVARFTVEVTSPDGKPQIDTFPVCRRHRRTWIRGIDATPHHRVLISVEEIPTALRLSDDQQAYVDAIRSLLASNRQAIAKWLTPICTECGNRQTGNGVQVDDDDYPHVMIDGYVAIGCEGYFTINPHAIGFGGAWDDWTDGCDYEATCKSCDETFNPADASDLEHLLRADESECGGTGEISRLIWRR